MKVEDKAGLRPSDTGSFTEPFGLLSRVRRPATQLDWVPGLDILLIALLFGLTATRFVAVAGVDIELPQTDLAMRAATGQVTVLTIGNRGMLFFEGDVFELSTIDQALVEYIKKARARRGSDLVNSTRLLIKTEGSIELEDILTILEMAKNAGFGGVQVAAQGNDVVGDPKALRQEGEAARNGFLPAN